MSKRSLSSRAGGRLTVQVVSDLHLEIRPDATYPSEEDLQTEADIVLVPGDVARAPDSIRLVVQLFGSNGALVVVVPGNHEHYKTGLTIDEGIAVMRRAAAGHASVGSRVIFLEDDVVVAPVNGIPVRFIGATLWTDFALFGDPEADMRRVGHALNDYRAIRGAHRDLGPWLSTGVSYAPLQPKETLERHRQSRAIIAEALRDEHPDGPTIVLTHHLPSMRSVAARWRRDRVSAGFASACDDLVGLGATLWVHGHTHDSCRWRDASGTLTVCNPAGYAQGAGRENGRFDPRLLLDLRRGGPGGHWRAGLAAKPRVLREGNLSSET